MAADTVSNPRWDPRLEAHFQAWRAKPCLRTVYADFYRLMDGDLPTDGRILEIGAGAGHSEGLLNSDCRLDILPSPNLNVRADAHHLPFADASFAGIALVDVLHHLIDLGRFFDEAARVLKPGGRIAMMEPGITPLSRLIYGAFHEEPVDMGADPLKPAAAAASERDPFESNQAIPTLLFTHDRYRRALAERCPALRVVRCRWLSLFAYPLSGGFKAWHLIPDRWVVPLLRLEERLMPVLGRWMAFRLYVAMEKDEAS